MDEMRIWLCGEQQESVTLYNTGNVEEDMKRLEEAKNRRATLKEHHS